MMRRSRPRGEGEAEMRLPRGKRKVRQKALLVGVKALLPVSPPFPCSLFFPHYPPPLPPSSPFSPPLPLSPLLPLFPPSPPLSPSTPFSPLLPQSHPLPRSPPSVPLLAVSYGFSSPPFPFLPQPPPGTTCTYHLYVSYACPWASRCLMALKLKGLDDAISVTKCLMALKLKGLDDAISVTVLNPTWVRTREGEEHFGWAFPSSEGDAEEPGAQPDPIFGARFILFDKKAGTIVNNESAEIMRMLNSEFNAVAANPHVDLYPAAMRGAIDGVNEWVGPAINSGVFKCGFAKEQAAYDAAIATLFAALDRCEDVLSKQRYMAGDAFTEADIRLFVDLIRFDEVYYGHFNCNKRMIQEYPNLFNYTKEIFQLPGIGSTVNMAHIRKKFFCSPNALNPFAICPIGRNIDYSEPHNRDKLPSEPLVLGTTKSGL
ncbi:unnamed protein product [Closterium sp. NIES-64]|nr:unnamed protein product [Closterium sp. NIES-64]